MNENGYNTARYATLMCRGGVQKADCVVCIRSDSNGNKWVSEKVITKTKSRVKDPGDGGGAFCWRIWLD